MSEYGGGLSLVQMFNLDKERLLKALDGQLVCGETEDGFEYENASEEECRAYIISVFDNAVYHALQGYQSGRIIEKTIQENGIDVSSRDFFLDYLTLKLKDDEEYTKREAYNYGDPDNPDDFEE